MGAKPDGDGNYAKKWVCLGIFASAARTPAIETIFAIRASSCILVHACSDRSENMSFARPSRPLKKTLPPYIPAALRAGRTNGATSFGESLFCD
jgi:hypothetical protein